MIIDSILTFFANFLTAIVNLIPDEGSTSYAQTITSDVGSALGSANGGTLSGLISHSPVVVMVDFTILGFVSATAMAIIIGLFGAKIVVFLWQQVKW